MLGIIELGEFNISIICGYTEGSRLKNTFESKKTNNITECEFILTQSIFFYVSLGVVIFPYYGGKSMKNTEFHFYIIEELSSIRECCLEFRELKLAVHLLEMAILDIYENGQILTPKNRENLVKELA